MTAENRSRDGGNVWLIVLIALALIATVIMLFSDSAMWLQIALLAALWAAIMGFMLVARARHDRDRAEAALESQERAYRAEVEALNARNDAHHASLQAARASEGLPPVADMEVLHEIREELATLRAQLEDLAGREFYEPAALQAEARRIHEIEAATSRVVPSEELHREPVHEPQGAGAAGAASAAVGQADQAVQTEQARAEQDHAAQARAEQDHAAQPQAEADEPASFRWRAPGAEDDTSRIAPVRDEEEEEAISALTTHPDQHKDQHNKQANLQNQQNQQANQPASKQTSKQAGNQREAAGSHRADALRDGGGSRRAETARPTQAANRAGVSRPVGAPSTDAVAGRVGTHRAPEGRNPLTDLIRERQEELARAEEQRKREQEAREREAREAQQREARERWEREQREAQEAHEAEQRAQEPAQESAQDHRGRRRADERGDGAISVADLLARNNDK